MANEKRECENCRAFYFESGPQGETTVCRLNPPTAFLTRIHRAEDTGAISGMENSSIFPFVRRNWKCEQFRQRLVIVEGEEQ